MLIFPSKKLFFSSYHVLYFVYTQKKHKHKNGIGVTIFNHARELSVAKSMFAAGEGEGVEDGL